MNEAANGPLPKPWLTPTLAALALVFTLAVPTWSSAPSAPELSSGGDDSAALAFAYWRAHGHLEPGDETLAFANRYYDDHTRAMSLAAIRELGMRARPQAADDRREQQQELTRLEKTAPGMVRPNSLLGSDPRLARFSFSPADASALSFSLHSFVHAGWPHWLVVALFFVVLGVRNERTIGTRALAILVTIAIASGAAVTALFAEGATRGELGGGAVVSALVAYTWVRQRRASPWVPWRSNLANSGRVLALPVIWLTVCLSADRWWPVPATGPSSGLYAEFGGALSGIALACVPARGTARRIRPWIRWPTVRTRKSNAQPPHPLEPPPSILDEAWVALDMGETDRAFALFRRAARRHPTDPEITRALWSVAVAIGHAEEVVDEMSAQIRHCLRSGKNELAAELWRELVEQLPDVRLPAEDLFRLVAPLLDQHPIEFALAALRQCVDAPPGELSIGLALQILDTAETLDPQTALRAAHRALELPDLHVSKREHILVRVRELAPAGPEAVPGESKIVDGSSLPRFDTLRQVTARPVSLEAEVLYFELQNGRRAKVAWRDVQAIAVAAVNDLSAKPVVVVDLLLNWHPSGDTALRSIRLRSDLFDPRVLTPDEQNATQALRRFLDRLLAETQAVPLPDENAARGHPFRAYEFTRTYQRRVLKIDC